MTRKAFLAAILAVFVPPLLTRVGAAQTTTVVATNVPITGPFISSPITMTGTLVDATVDYTIAVPAGVTVRLDMEQSADNGSTWQSFYSDVVMNPAVPRHTQFHRIFTLPGVPGLKVRANFSTVTAPVTIVLLTVTQ